MPRPISMLSKQEFFGLCAESLDFSPADGNTRFDEDLGRSCYRVSFKQNRSDGYIIFRIYYDCGDSVWCDIESSYPVSQVRLNDLATYLHSSVPPMILRSFDFASVGAHLKAIGSVISTKLVQIESYLRGIPG